MSTLAAIAAISAGSAKLATDTATLNTMTAAVEAQKAAVEADATANSAADATLSAALLADGPCFVLNPDGTANVYANAATPPGYTIVVAKPAA